MRAIIGRWGSAGALLCTQLLASSAVLAQDGATFSFEGRLVGACRVTTENVSLSYEIGDFTGVGKDLPWEGFNILSAGCDEGVNSRLKIAITGPIDPVDNTLFRIDGVGGVGLEVQTSDGRPVSPDGSSPPSWTPGDVGFIYSYRARFSQHSSVVTPGVGRVTATVTLSLD